MEISELKSIVASRLDCNRVSFDRGWKPATSKTVRNKVKYVHSAAAIAASVALLPEAMMAVALYAISRRWVAMTVAA